MDNFSVVIPTHNVEPWIGETLESIRNQVRQPQEIIIADDGSTDGTLEVANKSGLPIKVIKVSHGNAAATRNEGVKVATGDWIAFLDGDDIWHSNHLSTAEKLLAGTTNVAVFCKYDERRADPPNIRVRPPLYPADRRDLTDKDLAGAYAGDGHGFPTSGMVVLKSRFNEVGGFDVTQKRRHDMEMFLRLVAGHSWSYGATDTWTYRINRPGNISGNSQECAYFTLRAFLSNEERYGGKLDPAIRKSATRVLGCYHEIKNKAIKEQAWDAALPRVSLPRKLIYGCAHYIPGGRPLLYLVRRLVKA